MSRTLAGRTVVITGATSGIGRATAAAFVAAGARVVAGARDETALRGLIEELGASRACAVPVDVSDPVQVQKLAATAAETFGRIDVWVNNAAVHQYGWFEDIEPDEFARVIQVDTMGQVHGARAAIPYLARNLEGGSIIGVSSLEAVQAVPLQAPYVTSKHAVRGFYRALRLELRMRHPTIAVSTILPAGIDTPIFEHARTDLDRLPKPPSPLYAPEVAARSILYAAQHRSREVFVGGLAAPVLLGERLAPTFMDFLSTRRLLAIQAQQTGEPAPEQDNFYGSAGQPHTRRGRVGRNVAHLRGHSPVTSLMWHHPNVKRGVIAAGLAAAAWIARR